MHTKHVHEHVHPSNPPKIGEIYRHFKGGLYQIVRVCPDYPNCLLDGQKLYFYSSDDRFPPRQVVFTTASDIKRGETVVFYQGTDLEIWARSLENFTQKVPGEDFDRFLFVEPIEHVHEHVQGG